MANLQRTLKPPQLAREKTRGQLSKAALPSLRRKTAIVRLRAKLPD